MIQPTLIDSNEKHTKKQEDIDNSEPLPALDIQTRKIHASISRFETLSESRDVSTITIYGIEFRFKPSEGVKNHLELSASFRIGDDVFRHAFWLKSKNSIARLSAGESDDLILIVEKNNELFHYEVSKEKIRGNRILLRGVYNPLQQNNVIELEVEYICRQHRKIVQTKKATLRLSKEGEKTSFDFEKNFQLES